MLLDDMNLQFNLCNMLAGFCGVNRELNIGNISLQGLKFIYHKHSRNNVFLFVI